MTNFSTDADLLKWEPALMREIVLDHQCLTQGNGASSETSKSVPGTSSISETRIRA